MKSKFLNPFTILSPEGISAEEAIGLFVDVFTDFYNVPKIGHTFINGHRGSGKSMMFRYMIPDCQQLVLHEKIDELDYYAVYIPIKNTDLNLIELERLENKYASVFLNEHFMILHFMVKTFLALKDSVIRNNIIIASTEIQTFNNSLLKIISEAGFNINLTNSPQDAIDLFSTFANYFNSEYRKVIFYLRKLAFSLEVISYDGTLCGYLDFFLPVIQLIKKISFLPNNPIYFLIDDADNLNNTQTIILNTWVSRRTNADICLKISTQLNYKTYRTINGSRIDSPHDYTEVNISSIYTSSKSKYRKRVYDIVKKRFKKFDIKSTPEEYFPNNEEQENEIKEIEKEIIDNFSRKGRGYSARDDAYRYARPEYIKRLVGTRKKGFTYSYAGFDQLVNISSGIVRDFLEPASLMFGEKFSNDPNNAIKFIGHSIQNKIIKQYSYDFFFTEFDKIIQDETNLEAVSGHKSTELENLPKLRNLIDALGRTFHRILISDASERRVFSFALSDDLDEEIQTVLKLGIKYGYFHESSIGNKDGTGRSRLYILSRRLAPQFKLDPTSFAGYKFITCSLLKNAMYKPNSFVNKIIRRGVSEILEESTQLLLFED